MGLAEIRGKHGFGLDCDNEGAAAKRRTFERDLKAAKIIPARKGVLPTVRKNFVVVFDDKDDVKSGLHTVEGRRSLQAAADYEIGFKAARATQKEAAADLERQENKDVPKTRDLGLVWENAQSNELHDFRKGFRM